MPRVRGTALVALLSVLSALGWVGGLMYAPTMPQIGTELRAGMGEVQLTLTVYAATFALAPLVFGTLADRFGRRVTMLASLALMAVGSLFAASADSIGILLLARFIQAAGGAGPIVVARAVARDTWTFEQVRRPMAVIAAVSALAPAIALATGGFFAVALGWRGVFWLATGLAVGLFGLCYMSLQETRNPERAPHYSGRELVASYGKLLVTPQFLAFALAQGLLGSAIFVVITATPFVVLESRGVQPEVFGLLTSIIPAGAFLGNLIAGWLARAVSLNRMTGAGSTVALMSAVVLLAATIAGTLPVPLLYVAMFIYCVGFGATLPNLTAGAIEVRPDISGSAAALLAFLHQSCSALGSLIVSRFETGDGLAMVVILFALTAAGTACVAVAATYAYRTGSGRSHVS